jgi:YidC/Oxa1 family membrane protein insertase
MITDFFRTILYQPLFNGLVFLYESVAFEDLGVAIILLTVVVRLILFPLFHKTAKHQKIAQELQPEVKKIQKEHKNNKEAQTKALMELYQEHKVNPFTPIFLLLLQLPVLFALYRIFINGFSDDALLLLYSFVPEPQNLTQTFLGVIDLSVVNFPLVIAAAAAQFLQGKLAAARINKKKGQQLAGQAEKMAKMGIFLGPVIALVILTRFPAALALYWLTSTLFSIIQQVIVNFSVQEKEES